MEALLSLLMIFLQGPTVPKQGESKPGVNDKPLTKEESPNKTPNTKAPGQSDSVKDSKPAEKKRPKTDDPAFEKLIKEGEALLEKKENEKAVTHFTRLIESKPKANLGVAYFNRAGALVLLGKLGEAEKDLKKSIELDPANTMPYQLLAYIYIKTNRVRMAVAELNTAIQMDPKDYKAYNNRAGAYLEMRDFEKAIADLDKVIELQPDKPGRYLARGYANLKARKFASAFKDFDSEIARYPRTDSTAFLYRLAAQQQAAVNGDDAKVAEVAEKIATSIAETNEGLHLAYGDDEKKAIDHFDRAIAKWPDNFLAYNSRGTAYFNLKDYKRAIANFEKVTQMAPDFPEGYLNLAKSYLAQQRHNPALAILSKPPVTNWKIPEAIMMQATSSQAIGKNKEALEDFNLLEKIDPKYPRLFALRAQLHMNMRNFKAALADCERELAKDPTGLKGAVFTLRSAIHREMGENDKADEDLKLAEKYADH